MKNYLYKGWVKIVAMVLCSASAVAALALLVLLIFLGKNGYYFGGDKDMRDSLYHSTGDAYSAQLLDNAQIIGGSASKNNMLNLTGNTGAAISAQVADMPQDPYAMFADSKRFKYGVVRCRGSVEDVDLSDEKNWIYKSPGFDGEYSYFFEGMDGGNYRYDVSSAFKAALYGAYCDSYSQYVHSSSELYSDFVNEVIDKSHKLGYDSKCMCDFYVYTDRKIDKNFLFIVPRDENLLLWCESIQLPDDKEIADGAEVYLGFTTTEGDYTREYIYGSENTESITKGTINLIREVSGGVVGTEEDETPYSLYYDFYEDHGADNIYVLYDLVESDGETVTSDGLMTASQRLDAGFYEADILIDRLLGLAKNAIALLVISFIIALALFIYLCIACGRRADGSVGVLRKIDHLPIEIYTAGVCIIGMAGMAIIVTAGEDAFEYYPAGFAITGCGFIAAALAFMSLAWLLSVIARCKAKSFKKTTLIYYIYNWVKKTVIGPMGNMSENWTPAVRAMIIAAVYVVAQIIIMLWTYDRSRPVLGTFLLIVLGGAAGFGLLKLAERLTRVSDAALDRAMKSEHLKTELITNVSHDIKTPLTSIISYVDLLQKENIEGEKAKEYLEVLARQSGKLKRLIEDLIEASKASSGNLEINLDSCDASVLLSQVVGEFSEKLENAGVDVVVNDQNAGASIMADGRYLYRIFDNLMNNISKYALSGTRAYVDMEQIDGKLCITFKNISKAQLNISADELMERFVRGDRSRNTEGNGLGLSIAKSLTTAMGGDMDIHIDGDLFKVTVQFPVA
ncbi:MAG: HAMP domain-containing histidine kinase [Lachnospiraceae bacterium]|nr:HAMP domain-containing histidine kinase [Lachnospiraceae bacterium]